MILKPNTNKLLSAFSTKVKLYVSVFMLLSSITACDFVESSGAQTSNDSGVKQLHWSDSEKVLLKTLSIKHLPELPLDPSNQYLHNQVAIEFGKRLFFDPSLSQTGTISCSTCHQPSRQFSDGMRVANGVKLGMRNTPSLLGVAHQQWLFWDGRKDSVWAQALEPFEDPNEHNLTRIAVIQKVFGNTEYFQRYESIFKDTPSAEEFESWPESANPNGDIKSLKLWKSLTIETRKRINQVYANIGKSIAAYEATLKFPESRFDHFLSQLDQGSELTVLSENEQLGLKLFIGKASCINCHHSALLSSQHFQNIGTGTRGKDMGRSQVAEAQAWDEFNCLGDYSDAPESACNKLKFMSKDRHELAGSYKVPSLRNVSKTGPYMHDGRFKSLGEVVLFYINPPSQKLTGHHLPEIKLDEKEQDRLINFLNTL